MKKTNTKIKLIIPKNWNGGRVLNRKQKVDINKKPVPKKNK